MARTKPTKRRSILPSKSCHRRQCYEAWYINGRSNTPASRSGPRALPGRPRTRAWRPIPSTMTANFLKNKKFPQFAKLPQEIQSRVWEIVATEPRVVVVNSKTNNGLYSSVPAILHVCSESRAVALKHYTLAFASQPMSRWADEESNKVVQVILPARVYFNFERDTLYFREDWNLHVDGAWSCFNQFWELLNEDDLERVKRVGFDVNAKVCCLNSAEHYPIFGCWNALETLYLGYHGIRLGRKRLIDFCELERKDYGAFMRAYRNNPTWRSMEGWPDDVEAIEQLRTDVPRLYHRDLGEEEADRCLQKLELVSVVPL